MKNENACAAKDLLDQWIEPSRVRLDEPMAVHCSFRAGGTADLFVEIKTQEELVKALSACGRNSLPVYVMGRGTNLLVVDEGFHGAILCLAGSQTEPMNLTVPEAVPSMEMLSEEDLKDLFTHPVNGIAVYGTTIVAGAGVSMAALAKTAQTNGLSGLEFASGIPGSVGGGLVMNAGAYDGEMKQVVRSAKVMLPGGEFWELDNEHLKFGYRTSLFRHMPAVALEARFELTPGEPETIQAKMDDLNGRRREKQPLEYPSAGSTFKRPEGHFAGKLIQDAGLAGYTIGGAQVSEKHCGFIINKDHASATDIVQLIEYVQKRVYENSGVKLEREVILLGS